MRNHREPDDMLENLALLLITLTGIIAAAIAIAVRLA